MTLWLEAGEADARLLVVDALADSEGREQRFLLLEPRGGIVAALDVRAAEAGELDRLARCREDGLLTVASAPEISIAVRRTRASTICDAIVRFQISS